jgi:transposase
MNENCKAKIKPKNKKELAALYGVSVKTFNKWIEPFKDKIGKMQGRMYTPKQVRVIFDCLGEP